jgi:hypothetical protein
MGVVSLAPLPAVSAVALAMALGPQPTCWAVVSSVDNASEAVGEQGGNQSTGHRPMSDRVDATADAGMGIAGGLVGEWLRFWS